MGPLLKKMQKHRGEQFVHLGQALLRPPYGVTSEADAFAYRDIQAALEMIGEILNGYAGLLFNTDFKLEIPGEEDDFQRLLATLARHSP
jgi:hypothetical protein